MNPILVHPEPGIFPGNPSNEFSDCGNMAASGVFGIGFAIPRVSLHHSCFAILIVASPGVIISVIPAGIFAVHVPAPCTCKVASSVHLDFTTSWTQAKKFLSDGKGHKRDACASVGSASLIRDACASISQTKIENLP